MNHVVVDQERCLHDGLCISSCPVSVLEPETTFAGAVPTSSQGDRCIRCGHCVSICRAGALALTFLPRGDLRPMNTAHTISPEHVEQLLQARRSIRRYRDKLVPREIIARALDSARFAPSGVNRQPVAWTVVSGFDAVHRLAAGVLEWARMLVEQKHPLAARFDFARFLASLGKGRGSDSAARTSRGAGPFAHIGPHWPGRGHHRDDLLPTRCIGAGPGHLLGRISTDRAQHVPRRGQAGRHLRGAPSPRRHHARLRETRVRSHPAAQDSRRHLDVAGLADLRPACVAASDRLAVGGRGLGEGSQECRAADTNRVDSLHRTGLRSSLFRRRRDRARADDATSGGSMNTRDRIETRVAKGGRAAHWYQTAVRNAGLRRRRSLRGCRPGICTNCIFDISESQQTEFSNLWVNSRLSFLQLANSSTTFEIIAIDTLFSGTKSRL